MISLALIIWIAIRVPSRPERKAAPPIAESRGPRDAADCQGEAFRVALRAGPGGLGAARVRTSSASGRARERMPRG